MKKLFNHGAVLYFSHKTGEVSVVIVKLVLISDRVVRRVLNRQYPFMSVK